MLHQKLVLEKNGGGFAYIKSDGTGGETTDLTDALTAAGIWNIPFPGSSGRITDDDGRCLNLGSHIWNPQGWLFEPGECGGNGSNWNVLAGGQVENAQAVGNWLFRSGSTNQLKGNSSADAMRLRVMPVNAVVSGIDLEAGTAKLVDGVAPEDAETVDVTWKTVDGSTRTRTATVVDGTWTRQLNDLPLGKTTVHLTAYAGADVVAESDLDVDLAVSELTASPIFDDDVEQVAHVTGTATPRTTIKAFHGDRLVQTTMSDADGAYSLAINPPNAGGPYDLQIVQEIRGEQASSKGVRLEYGTAVSIDSPENDEPLDPGEDLVVSGKAQPGAKLTVSEQDSDTPLKELTVGTTGTYRAVIDGDTLEDREYKLVVTAVSAGYNITSAEVTINPGKSIVKQPTAHVDFDADVTRKAVVSGEGAEGATITVKNGSKTLGNASVTDGTWSLPIDPIGAGKHTLDIEQTGIEGTQVTTAEADYGDAVAITSQADGKVAPGVTEISGTTQAGAQVQVTVGGKIIDATVEGTTWKAQAEIAPSPSPLTITATQRSKGALTTTDTKQVTTDAQQEAKDVTITDPADHTFTPQQTTTVRGTATPFAKIEVRFQWNDSVQATTTANAKGEWSFDRKYGMATYELTATQTRLDGTTKTSAPFVMGPDGSFLPLTLLTPSPISSFIPGSPVHFSGTATKNATITATAPEWNDNVVFTAKADENGNWKYDRQFAKGVTYRLVLTQVDGGGNTDQITGIVLTDATS